MQTIGGSPASGICGTGVLEVVYELLKEELIDEGSKAYYDEEVADGKVRGNCHLIWGDADIFAGK